MIYADGLAYGVRKRQIFIMPPITPGQVTRVIDLPFRYRAGQNELRVELNGRQHFVTEHYIEVSPTQIQTTFDLSHRDQVVVEKV